MSDYQAKVHQDILEWISNCNKSEGREISDMQANGDLLSTGIVDSLDFIRLLAYIEDTYSVIVDLIDTELTELSTVDGLANYITRVKADSHA